MLFDLTFPCYLTTFSGKKCLSKKVICAFNCPAYRSSPVSGFLPGFCSQSTPRPRRGAWSVSRMLGLRDYPGFFEDSTFSLHTGPNCGVCLVYLEGQCFSSPRPGPILLPTLLKGQVILCTRECRGRIQAGENLQ
jgi:hypothetical protein